MSDMQGLLAAACGALVSVLDRGQVVATLCVTLTVCECVFQCVFLSWVWFLDGSPATLKMRPGRKVSPCLGL